MNNYHRALTVALLSTSLAVSISANAQDAPASETVRSITVYEVQAEISEAFAKISVHHAAAQ